MDDIFSTQKEEQDPKSDSNMEWKKSGIDKNERLTLKINVKEANMYDANKRNDTRKKVKPEKIPPGFKKISKKIRDSFDEDEDEDDYILVPVFQEYEESSIIKALTPDEKRLLKQFENTDNVRQHEIAAKEAALQNAEKAIRQAGIDGLDKKAVIKQMSKPGKVSTKEAVEETLRKKSVRKKQVDGAETKNEHKVYEKGLASAKTGEEKEVKRTMKTEELKEKQAKAEERANRMAAKKEEFVAKEQAEQQKVEEVKEEAKKLENVEAKPEATKEAPQPEPKEKSLDELLADKDEKQPKEEKSIREMILEKSGRAQEPEKKVETTPEKEMEISEELKTRQQEEQMKLKREHER